MTLELHGSGASGGGVDGIDAVVIDILVDRIAYGGIYHRTLP